MSKLINVSLRSSAIYVPSANHFEVSKTQKDETILLVANLAKLGYTVSENLLNALYSADSEYLKTVLAVFRDVMGVDKNWTPLVKGWDVPTGESIYDHIVTFFANIFQVKGPRLQCGHIIPEGTFNLERYNGCPFCGTPFEFGTLELKGQGSKLKMLDLWTEKDANKFLKDLLASKTALDATQLDSLKILLSELPFPEVTIEMKETLMQVIDYFVSVNENKRAEGYFSNPNDILRYLWYKHTGFYQIITPKTIINRKASNGKHITKGLDTSGKALLSAKAELKLKYNRKDCLRVANWINNLALPVEKSCEIMHPKRGMWVRLIRALRLAEYSQKPGFEKLKSLIDTFYNEKYEVFEGRLNHFRLKTDADKTFALLKQRPGLFARSLFANILWFGPEKTIAAFSEVIDQVPARLVFTLNMYAENYFNRHFVRSVKPLGGISKSIPANKMLKLYNDDKLAEIKSMVEDLCILAMKKRFENTPNENKTIYIEPMLYKMPVSIGDRSETIQDMPSALMGTRFPIEGDTVRLFMQWGNDMPAQHLDMDLSCHLAYDNNAEICSYSRLVATGCKHSGDIRSIPEKIGTAEYIDIDVKVLREKKINFVTFTCNAYSGGSMSPNMIIGWMNSKNKMTISETNGVAYDPSCVQHQVKITTSMTKGMVFGVLDVAKHEIVWLEMPFFGQVVQNLSSVGVQALLQKLDAKLTIGKLLKVKAEAQGLEIVETPEADEVYDLKWGQNAAAVTQLLVE